MTAPSLESETASGALNDVVCDFWSTPKYDTEHDTEGVGGIECLRVEVVDVQRLPNVRFLSTQVVDKTPQSALVVERLRKGSHDLVTHTYSLTAPVLQYLKESAIPLLLEDAKLLSFTMSMTSGEGTLFRGILHRKIKPLSKENELLREAIGISKTEHITPLRIKSAVSRLAAASPSTSSQFVDSAPAAAQSHQPNREPAANDSAAGGGAAQPKGLGVHSPLLWELETTAAVNARTRYRAYPEHAEENTRRRLDMVTQQQLVGRLHDLSMDHKRRRLVENEEKLLRELGHHERRVLTPEEQHDLGSRLHDKQREHTQKLREQLKTVYLSPSPKRQLSKEEQDTSNKRIYYSVLEKTRDDLQHLFEQYVLASDLPKSKLSLDQQQALANRLSHRGDVST